MLTLLDLSNTLMEIFGRTKGLFQVMPQTPGRNRSEFPILSIALASSICNYQPIGLREGLTGTFPFSGIARLENDQE